MAARFLQAVMALCVVGLIAYAFLAYMAIDHLPDGTVIDGLGRPQWHAPTWLAWLTGGLIDRGPAWYWYVVDVGVFVVGGALALTCRSLAAQRRRRTR